MEASKFANLMHRDWTARLAGNWMNAGKTADICSDDVASGTWTRPHLLMGSMPMSRDKRLRIPGCIVLPYDTAESEGW